MISQIHKGVVLCGRVDCGRCCNVFFTIIPFILGCCLAQIGNNNETPIYIGVCEWHIKFLLNKGLHIQLGFWNCVCKDHSPYHAVIDSRKSDIDFVKLCWGAIARLTPPIYLCHWWRDRLLVRVSTNHYIGLWIKIPVQLFSFFFLQT